MSILIGADPELFVKKAGKLISGFNLIPGTKEEPHKVERGAVQVDGMALEFNVDPSTNADEFCSSIDAVIAQLQELVPDCELVAEPVAHFGKELMDEQPAEAVELGCDPDYTAYDTGLQENPIPDVTADFRTGAGHIHIGWCEDVDPHSSDHVEMCKSLVRNLDLLIGVPFLLFDTDHKRRELYGKAGSFRPKPYGCEYRVLSNKWVGNEEITRWIYKQIHIAIDALKSGMDLEEEALIAYRFDAQRTVDTNCLADAKTIIKELGLEVPECFGQV